jgi:hypothetical protein
MIKYDWNNTIAMHKWNIFKGNLFAVKLDYVFVLKKVIVTNNDWGTKLCIYYEKTVSVYQRNTIFTVYFKKSGN